MREPHHRREHAFGDAVGHVDAGRLAPFRDDVTLVHDEAGLVATLLDRTDRVTERLAAEGLVVIDHEVARVLRLARDRVVDRGLQPRAVDAGLGRRPALPDGIREIAGLGVNGS